MRLILACAVVQILLASVNLQAQIVQLTLNPEVPDLPKSIQIEAVAQGDQVPALVAWGSTLLDDNDSLRPVLYVQAVNDTGPLKSPTLITDSKSVPANLVRVIPLNNMYLVLWNDAREDQPGLYGQYVTVGGTPIGQVAEMFGAGEVTGIRVIRNDDGSILLVWNAQVSGPEQEGRLMLLNRNGNRVGDVQALKGVKEVFHLGWNEFDLALVLLDGTALPVSPEGEIFFNHLIPEGRLSSIALFGDGDVWTVEGETYYHFPDITAVVPDDSLSLPDPYPSRVGALYPSHLSDSTITVNYLDTNTVTLIDEFQWLKKETYFNVYSFTYNRAGVILGRDTTRILTCHYESSVSGSTSSSWWWELKWVHSGSSSCPGERRTTLTIIKSSGATRQGVWHDTVSYYWGIDPSTHEITTASAGECRLGSVPSHLPVSVTRVSHHSISKVHVDHYGKIFALAVPAPSKPYRVSTGVLGLSAYNGRLHFFDNTYRKGGPENGFIYRSAIDDLATGTTGRYSTTRVDTLPPHVRSFPESALLWSRVERSLTLHRVGPMTLIIGASFRHDSFEPVAGDDTPSYQALSLFLTIDSADGRGHVGEPFNYSVHGEWNDQNFPLHGPYGWDPVRGETVLYWTHEGTTSVVAVDTLGEISWQIEQEHHAGRNSSLVPRDRESVLVVDGTTVSLVNKAGSTEIGSLDTPLEDDGCIRLYGDRFARYGVDSTGALVLETYTLDLEPIRTRRVTSDSVANVRLLLSAEDGDSALVLLWNQGVELHGEFLNQSLEPALSNYLIATLDEHQRVDDIYAAFNNDSIVLAWVGSDMSNYADNEVYALGLPMPPIPEETWAPDTTSSLSREHVGNSPLSLHIYPNPVVSEVVVQRDPAAGGRAEVRIFDMFGRQVLARKMNRVVELDIEGLAPGVYYLEVIGGEGTIRRTMVKR